MGVEAAVGFKQQRYGTWCSAAAGNVERPACGGWEWPCGRDWLRRLGVALREELAVAAGGGPVLR